MNPPRISLLLADVDGTLVTRDKVLTERARAAVEALHQRGIRFAITSGRPPRGMAMLIEPLRLDTPIAAFNGGLFANPDLTVIASNALPPEIARRTVALVTEHGLDVWVYRGNDWLVRAADGPHVAREQWTVKFPPMVVEDFGDALEDAIKIVGVSDDYARVERCEAAAQQELAGLASAARSQPYYLDVTHPSANKGGVLDFLSRRLGIPKGEIATIGDMPNDILMFRESGLAIAMGNGGPEVRRAARLVTESCDEEGFAKAVERFILGPGPEGADAVSPARRPILVVMGVSGSGKTTVAKALAARLGWPFEEGDDLHPAANVAKMHAHLALTDADRRPWLEKVTAWIDGWRRDGSPGIITCSALKRSYRQVIADGRPEVRFVYLHGERALIAARLAARTGHFMPADLLDSQLAALEEPGPEEHVIAVDVGPAPEAIAAEVARALEEEGAR